MLFLDACVGQSDLKGLRRGSFLLCIGIHVDFRALVYGNGTDSLCGGGDGDMAQCDIRTAQRLNVV